MAGARDFRGEGTVCVCDRADRIESCRDQALHDQALHIDELTGRGDFRPAAHRAKPVNAVSCRALYRDRFRATRTFESFGMSRNVID
jgi:hypothetical protein